MQEREGEVGSTPHQEGEGGATPEQPRTPFVRGLIEEMGDNPQDLRNPQYLRIPPSHCETKRGGRVKRGGP